MRRTQRVADWVRIIELSGRLNRYISSMFPAPDRPLPARLGALVMLAMLCAGCQQVVDRLAVDTGWAAKDATSVPADSAPKPALANNPGPAPTPAPAAPPALAAQRPAPAAAVPQPAPTRDDNPQTRSRPAIAPAPTARIEPPQREERARITASQAPSTASTPATPTAAPSTPAPSTATVWSTAPSPAPAPSTATVWSTAPQPPRPAQVQPVTPAVQIRIRPVPVYIED